MIENYLINIWAIVLKDRLQPRFNI